MDIKLIKTDDELEAALAQIESLWHKEDEKSRDELELLGLVVSEYEKRTMPVGPVDPIDMLKFCMEQQGYKKKDLGELLGSRSRPTEILNRQRPLTLDMIRTISAAWNIPSGLLVGQKEPVIAKGKRVVLRGGKTIAVPPAREAQAAPKAKPKKGKRKVARGAA